ISPDNVFHPGGIYYNAMTFNGSIPGPAIEVNEGEIFQLTVRNDGELVHSIDFHGINGPVGSNTDSGSKRGVQCICNTIVYLAFIIRNLY
ncbi:MAG: multicopper oxidase domain-containing protein, partial [Nitrososphaeraceae archaeon]